MPPSDFAKADLSKILDELTIDEAISLIAGVGFWHTHAVERLGIPAIKVSDGPNGIRGNHFLMSTPAKVLLVSRALSPHLMLSFFVAFSINDMFQRHVGRRNIGDPLFVTLRSDVELTSQQSSTAMGATFDPELLHTIGLKLLAPEAKLRAASLALAPTCNIQRVCRSSIVHFHSISDLHFIRIPSVAECDRFLVDPPSQTDAISQSFESFSEDPYLSGIIASAYIKGLQEGGIGATIKHFWCVLLFYQKKHISDRRPA